MGCHLSQQFIQPSFCYRKTTVKGKKERALGSGTVREQPGTCKAQMCQSSKSSLSFLGQASIPHYRVKLQLYNLVVLLVSNAENTGRCWAAIWADLVDSHAQHIRDPYSEALRSTVFLQIKRRLYFIFALTLWSLYCWYGVKQLQGNLKSDP